MTAVNGRAGAHRRGGGLYLNCPQCGLSIVPRAKWVRVASRLPTQDLYRDGLAPSAEHPTADNRTRDP
ncbi:MAG: hypothetical protein ACXVH1_20255 [Solirubrobacteraceae bacterium]